MANPKIMCKQHLIGEYRELFTFLGTMRKQKKIDGYIRNNLLEPLSLEKRYNELREEMLNRNYKPKKEFLFDIKLLEYLKEDIINFKINKENALNALLCRCSICREKYNKGEINV